MGPQRPRVAPAQAVAESRVRVGSGRAERAQRREAAPSASTARCCVGSALHTRAVAA
jgi:hypothetical protein